MPDVPQTLEEAQAYKYGTWASNPGGYSYKEDRCAYEVQDSISWTYHQCSRKNGHGPAGLYCRQHAKIVYRQISRSVRSNIGRDKR